MSSIQKKLLNGLTGLGLIVFVIVHLAGNLSLFSKNPTAFNTYAKKLHDFGYLLYVAEIGLLFLFVFHIVSAILVYVSKRRARKDQYAKTGFAGGKSKKSISSISMIYTGIILLAFVVWHVISFRFGPGIDDGYVTEIKGEQARDLHRLVYEYFTDPLYVIIYVVVMILLGLHLRHGFWSTFQTLSLNNPKYSSLIYTAGLLFAILMAAGFLLIPVWIYFSGNGGI